MDEEALQQVVTRGSAVAFPDFGFVQMSQQVDLPSGPCDIRALDLDGHWWVIELKRDALTPTTIQQVLRYKRELDDRHRGTEHLPMIAGMRCSQATRLAAAAAGVRVHVFEKDIIDGLVAQFEVADRRRRRNGNATTPSAPRGPAVARGGYNDPERHALQSALDAAYPPGSLTWRSDIKDLREYWELACPQSRADVRAQVVRITAHILTAEPTTALVNRASSWTNLKLSNGAMVAALNANANSIKCDFWLPEALAGLVPYPNKGPRHPHSVWCQPRGLSTSADVTELLQWYDRALQLRRELSL